MKLIKFLVFIILGYGILTVTSCSNKEYVINTEYGDMTIELYDNAPKHKENFVKLISEGYYNGLLFHRVIKNFMIQGGDPESRNAPADKMLGSGGPAYNIDAEIGKKHIKGALSAARMPDHVNPSKSSSGSQFFIVQGSPVTDSDLDKVELAKNLKYTSEEREMYKKYGGTPMLDGDYSVFGRVIQGIEVVDKIASVATNPQDRPIQDIIMSIK